MKIRPANKTDLPQIISLLQASLGESLLKKSVAIWNFKHEDNPFGASPVLLAEEDSTLIGVRAFMSWQWKLENEVWNSYRAVDTATHPQHQGKGIFKILTLNALDLVHQKGDSFVFNTPNEQSRPGYLKMGWEIVGKIKVALVPTFFYLFLSLFSKKIKKSPISSTELAALCDKHNLSMAQQKKLFTPKSPEYLKWRYEENPLQQYTVFTTSDCYLAMYVKEHRFFKELRVAEVITNKSAKTKSDIQKAIVSHALKNNCMLITTANPSLFTFRFYGDFGPKLTFKSLTDNNAFIQKAKNIQNWHYSLGDLELF